MKTIKTIHLIRAFVCIYVLAAGWGFWCPVPPNTCFYLTFQCLFIDGGWLFCFPTFRFVLWTVCCHFCYFCRPDIWVKSVTGDKWLNAEPLNSSQCPRKRLARFLTFLLFGAIIMSCTQRQKGKQQMASLLAKRNPIRKDSIGVISMISISPRTILTPCERAAVREWGWQVAHGAHDWHIVKICFWPAWPTTRLLRRRA